MCLIKEKDKWWLLVLHFPQPAPPSLGSALMQNTEYHRCIRKNPILEMMTTVTKLAVAQ